MKNFNRKGQAATEFLMTYGWAILAIVIVAAVLWNMGIFKGSCTPTAPVQVFPSGSQLQVSDWVLNGSNNLNMTVQNLAGQEITITMGMFKISGNVGAFSSSAITVPAGERKVVEIMAGGTGTSGNCFNDGKIELKYTISGGQPHNISGTIQGKY